MKKMGRRINSGEVKTKSDDWIIYQVLNNEWERLHPYAPVRDRLQLIMEKVASKVKDFEVSEVK